MVRGRLQLKEEELSALQGRIAERAEQLLQLLDRRRGRWGGREGRMEGVRKGGKERGRE